MRGLVLAALIIGLASARTQPTFKSAVQLVTVPITVTNDARDKLIMSGLGRDDFRIYENDVPQTVAVFSQERQPVSICFVVDASGSMDSDHRLERGIRALQQTARGLENGDEISIVRFAAVAAFAAMSLVYELKYQLTLGYTPTTPLDGKYRRIRVESNLKGLLVRHRGGYLALPSNTQ